MHLHQAVSCLLAASIWWPPTSTSAFLERSLTCWLCHAERGRPTAASKLEGEGCAPLNDKGTLARLIKQPTHQLHYLFWTNVLNVKVKYDQVLIYNESFHIYFYEPCLSLLLLQPHTIHHHHHHLALLSLPPFSLSPSCPSLSDCCSVPIRAPAFVLAHPFDQYQISGELLACQHGEKWASPRWGKGDTQGALGLNLNR